MLTAERVREVLNYDLETGIFTWRVKPSKNRVAGSVAGSAHADGRVYIRIEGYRTLASRIAWAWMSGEWPAEDMTIDHISGDPRDNRWSNLRIATRMQNQGNRKINRNNSSGFKGVEWHPGSGKWRAKIRSGGKGHHLGLFDNKSDAARAYMAAAEKKFGEFATSGERSARPLVK